MFWRVALLAHCFFRSWVWIVFEKRVPRFNLNPLDGQKVVQYFASGPQRNDKPCALRRLAFNPDRPGHLLNQTLANAQTQSHAVGVEVCELFNLGKVDEELVNQVGFGPKQVSRIRWIVSQQLLRAFGWSGRCFWLAQALPEVLDYNVKWNIQTLVLLVVACVCTVRDDLELVDFEFNDDRRVVRREFDRVVQEI